MLRIVPTTRRAACAFIDARHRHHVSGKGGKFWLACEDETGRVVGVAETGRPKARELQKNRLVCEVTRLCTDGTRNACSMLYGASWRVAREMGYRRIVTYILASEPGDSLRAAGWIKVAFVRGQSWSRRTRKRQDKHPTEDKWRWEINRALPEQENAAG